MRPSGILSIYSEKNRIGLLVLSVLLTVSIALLDWRAGSTYSLGILYLFPIMLAGGYLTQPQIVLMAVTCATMQELFGYNLPAIGFVAHFLFSWAGFTATGLFVSQAIRGRRLLGKQVELRRNAEEQLQALVDSSPAAIVTLDSNGNILLANAGAQQLFGAAEPLPGKSISLFLPALQGALERTSKRCLRTTLQCSGRRADGEIFLAGTWFSTYQLGSGTRLAAIVVDLSEDLRNREDLSFDYLLKNAQILMSAVSHEIRNLCGAAGVVHRNLSRVPELTGNADFEALGTLIDGLDRISSLDLPREDNSVAVELVSLLDESRIVIDSAYEESGMKVNWEVQDRLPLVRANRYGLAQVFLNLAKNSRRAMEHTPSKVLSVSAYAENEHVVVEFQDTGTGIAHPENLFRAFQKGAEATGLGLYISRAIVKNFGGDLKYRPAPQGSCFAVVLPAATRLEEEASK